jgi:hypothetical protein
MGLLGFITMAAYFDKNKYPPKYLRNSIEAIAFVGVLCKNSTLSRPNIV